MEYYSSNASLLISSQGQRERGGRRRETGECLCLDLMKESSTNRQQPLTNADDC